MPPQVPTFRRQIEPNLLAIKFLMGNMPPGYFFPTKALKASLPFATTRQSTCVLAQLPVECSTAAWSILFANILPTPRAAQWG